MSSGAHQALSRQILRDAATTAQTPEAADADGGSGVDLKTGASAGTSARMQAGGNQEMAKQQAAPSGGARSHQGPLGADVSVELTNGRLNIHAQVTRVSAQIEGAQVGAISLDATAQLSFLGAPFEHFDASLQLGGATVDAGFGLSGSGSYTLSESASAAAGDSRLAIGVGGAGGVALGGGEVARLTGGTTAFQGDLAISPDAVANVEGLLAFEATPGGFTGHTAGATLRAPMSFGPPDASMTADPEVSSLTARIDGAGVHVDGLSLQGSYRQSGAPFVEALDARITLASARVGGAGVSGDGSLQLSAATTAQIGTGGRVELSSGGGQAAFVDGRLQRFSGDVAAQTELPLGGGDVTTSVRGTLSATYDGAGLTGAISGPIESDVALDAEGNLTARAHQTKAKAALSANGFQQITLDLFADYTFAGQPFRTPLKLDVTVAGAAYDPAQGVSGVAGLALKEEATLGQGSDTVSLLPGASIGGELRQSEVASFMGHMPVRGSLTLEEGQLARFDGALFGRYDAGALSGTLQGTLVETVERRTAGGESETLEANVTSVSAMLGADGFSAVNLAKKG